jgi:PAS domain S-box-containing protein
MLRNHIHPDDAAGLDEAFRLCLQNHSVYEQEHRIMRPDDSVRFVQEVAHPYFDEHGKLVMYIGTTLDITNRKHAEEEIRHLNETLEQRIIERTAELSDLYNNAPCGYHSLDADGVFVHINQTELNWLGYRFEELVGKANIISLLTPASVEIFKQHFPVFKEVGLLNNLELEFMRKDGSVLPVLLSASAVRDQAGSYVESRTTLVDYTERKRVEEEMLKSRIQLEATNRELESFSYSVSHDLRSPLRGIDGWSLALLEDYGPILDEQGKAHIQKVRAEVQRMGVLIDDILQLSRITRAEMNKEKVDISAIAETVAARLQETKPANRQVEFVIQKGLTAMGDPKLLDVVLTNLLGNAFKFTSKLERSYIEFGRTVVEGKFAFYVRDNGAGFDMTHANKLFGAFQRMHRASEFPGTGIGLATVQRVVIRHGGSIWTSSEVGRGATFYFTLEDNNK